jgi:hypothetical protein
MNIKEATNKWINEFNFVSEALIKNAVGDDLSDWIDLTQNVITAGDTVYHDGEDWEVLEVDGEFLTLEPLDDELEIIEVKAWEVEPEEDYYSGLFPMWGTLFNPKSGLDEEWIQNNLEKVKECGLRAFEYYPTGDIFLGVDGAGYSFMDNHWIPLYKARGLQWHDFEEEVTE